MILEKKMSNEQEDVQLGAEDRLKAVLYQYIKLYDRWSDDRQVFMKHLSVLDESIEKLDKKVAKFGSLGVDIRDDILSSIRKEVKEASEGIGYKIGEAGYQTLGKTSSILKQSAQEASEALDNYRAEIKTSHRKIIAIAIGASVLSSILITKLIMPTPLLPLSDRNISALGGGLVLMDIWPNVPDSTRRELNNLAKQTANMEFPLPLSKKDDS